MRNPRHGSSSSATGQLTIVVKLGSSSIVNEASFQPQLGLLSAVVETICALRKSGHRVVLVSSGAIAMGLNRMQLQKRPKALQEKQALAAIGQGRLIALWDNLFNMLGQPIAQVLLTRNDISDRSRYLNSTKTLASLLNYGVIPIVNENDTVSVSEIKFGDNDTLSAITASMVEADYLFLFTDVDCLYTENPRRYPETAKPVRIVRDIEAVREIVSTATLGSSLGTGGMETKLIAAELATGAGVATVITHGTRPSSILDIVSQPNDISDDEYTSRTPLHTVFLPKETPLSDRRWWVLHGLKPRGRIIIDEGAYRAIVRSSSTSRTLSSITPGSLSADSTPSSSLVLPGPPAELTSAKSPAEDRQLHASTSGKSSSSSGNGGRLLAAGVIAVEGTFAAGQAVTVVVQRKRRSGKQAETSLRKFAADTPQETPHDSEDEDERTEQHTENDEAEGLERVEFGRGLANYNWQEIDKIKGHKSSEIERILGYIDAEHCVESITSLKRLEF